MSIWGEDKNGWTAIESFRYLWLKKARQTFIKRCNAEFLAFHRKKGYIPQYEVRSHWQRLDGIKTQYRTTLLKVVDKKTVDRLCKSLIVGLQKTRRRRR